MFRGINCSQNKTRPAAGNSKPLCISASPIIATASVMVTSGSPRNAPKAAQKPSSASIAAASLPYRPRDPKRYRPGIALIGCGGITSWHLRAYRDAKYNVVALCDINLANAEARRDEYYPAADVTDSVEKVLARDDVEVVDIATHTEVRPPLVEAALLAGKHVLSQKPFVVDLDEGERLADLAEKMNVRLAVNQNGRWAPHFSYVREAVQRGLLGTIDGVHCGVHWDHTWVKGSVFESIHHLILFDYAIHWFDFLTTVLRDEKPEIVYASLKRSAAQLVSPPLLAQALIEFPNTQSSLVFDACTKYGKLDGTVVTGSQGTIVCIGPSDKDQRVTLTTAEGSYAPRLVGAWFPDGFHGTMGELLCAIEDNREPTHSARNNLTSLALCFAAVASAERGEPVVPGTVRQLIGVATK